MRDPWSSPPGKNVATARVSSEDPSGRGGSQIRCLRGAGLCLRANRVAAQPAQGWAGLRGLPRSPCVHARRWPHDCRAGQCRLPQGRLAKDWWMTHQDRVQPLWLPAYAPQLNLMERVWGYAKDKLSCHRWWADGPALET